MIRIGSNPVSGFLIRGETQTHREGHEMREAETGLMQLQAKESQGWHTTARSQERGMK